MGHVPWKRERPRSIMARRPNRRTQRVPGARSGDDSSLLSTRLTVRAFTATPQSERWPSVASLLIEQRNVARRERRLRAAAPRPKPTEPPTGGGGGRRVPI